MHVIHVREAALQMCEQRGLARYGAEQEMLQPATNDRVKDRIAAMCHAIDFDHMTLGSLAIVLRKFAEGALKLALVRKNAPLENEFGICRNPHVIGQALDNFERLAMQRARDFKLIG